MLQRDRGPAAESLRRGWYQARGHKSQYQYGSAVRGSGGAAGLVRWSLGRLPHCGFLSPPSPASASVIGANLPSRPSPSGGALLILLDPVGRITRSRRAVSYHFLRVPLLLALYEIGSVPPTHKRGVHVLRVEDCVDSSSSQVPWVSAAA